MIPLYAMKIIQIDVTNACVNRCSNCTRFTGHHRKPFFMSLEDYCRAVDSLADFPGMVGMIGGEPLLHPRFPEMVEYLVRRIPDPKRRGLWSTAPGRLAKKYGALIRESFGHLFLNDHSVSRILHQPILIGAEELIEDRDQMWSLIDNCWVQTLWSATITPKGAFFCEVAASFDMLFGGPGGWPVEPGWWLREPAEFSEQKQRWCPRCGCSVPLRRRASTDRVDDVGIRNYAELKRIGSPKIAKGLFEIYDAGLVADWKPDPNWYMSAMEDERQYRQRIADRFATGGCRRDAGDDNPLSTGARS